MKVELKIPVVVSLPNVNRLKELGLDTLEAKELAARQALREELTDLYEDESPHPGRFNRLLELLIRGIDVTEPKPPKRRTVKNFPAAG